MCVVLFVETIAVRYNYNTTGGRSRNNGYIVFRYVLLYIINVLVPAEIRRDIRTRVYLYIVKYYIVYFDYEDEFDFCFIDVRRATI